MLDKQVIWLVYPRFQVPSQAFAYFLSWVGYFVYFWIVNHLKSCVFLGVGTRRKLKPIYFLGFQNSTHPISCLLSNFWFGGGYLYWYSWVFGVLNVCWPYWHVCTVPNILLRLVFCCYSESLFEVPSLFLQIWSLVFLTTQTLFWEGYSTAAPLACIILSTSVPIN